ncbi:MAG: metalloprotease [Rubricella sp.]
MVALLGALLVSVGTWAALRGGWRLPPRNIAAARDGRSMLTTLLAVLAAVYVFGPIGGLLIVISIAIHEFGHVAAFRVIGHTDAKFFLVPLMGGLAYSGRLPDREIESFFVSLMGPAICIAPVAVALALAEMLLVAEAPSTPALLLGWFGVLTAFINAFNLLPLWPLDGGKCARNVLAPFAPGLAHWIGLGTAGLLVAYAWSQQNLLLLAFALFFTFSALGAADLRSGQQPMRRGEALLGLLAWLSVFAFHAWAARDFLRAVL